MKRVFRWLLAMVVCVVLFGLWYNWRYSMGVAQSYQVNDKQSTYSLLITTQKSEYKEKVTHRITDRLKGMDVYVKVIDQTEFSDILPGNYDAFIFLHTWEMWKAPKNIQAFLTLDDIQYKTFVVSTSGGGDLFHEGIDGITSASIILDAENDADKAILWTKKLLSLY